ncbi:hypothetical protein CLOM_g17488 [Closterium sp. NIES-68]|nr:hypothetical protein CLOM_g17488 [Closterium sp. NIES-68]GJP86507.1 hypothetical protein CLOP_g16526 [Closterium sp. NIES-67]
MLRDTTVSTRLYKATEHLTIFRSFLILLERSGDGRLLLPLAFALWLSPVFTSATIRQIFLGIFLACILDLAIVGILKVAFRRPRPHYNRGMLVVVAPDQWSFPSGHASRAIMIAALLFHLLPPISTEFAQLLPSSLSHLIPTDLHRLFPETLKDTLSADLSPEFRVWSLMAAVTAWAVTTAGSRVFLGRHFVLDVAVGCLLGFLEALLVTRMVWPSQEVSEKLRELAVTCGRFQEGCSLDEIRRTLGI